MSVCEVYFKSKIPLELNHLIVEVSKEQLENNIYKNYPTLTINEKELQNIFNLAKRFYICFDNKIFKVTDI